MTGQIIDLSHHADPLRRANFSPQVESLSPQTITALGADRLSAELSHLAIDPRVAEIIIQRITAKRSTEDSGTLNKLIQLTAADCVPEGLEELPRTKRCELFGKSLMCAIVVDCDPVLAELILAESTEGESERARLRDAIDRFSKGSLKLDRGGDSVLPLGVLMLRIEANRASTAEQEIIRGAFRSLLYGSRTKAEGTASPSLSSGSDDTLSKLLPELTEDDFARSLLTQAASALQADEAIANVIRTRYIAPSAENPRLAQILQNHEGRVLLNELEAFVLADACVLSDIDFVALVNQIPRGENWGFKKEDPKEGAAPEPTPKLIAKLHELMLSHECGNWGRGDFEPIDYLIVGVALAKVSTVRSPHTFLAAKETARDVFASCHGFKNYKVEYVNSTYKLLDLLFQEIIAGVDQA